MIFSWQRTVLPIAALFSFRMLGLFMLIPVFSVLGEQLQGATPALIGVALGSYGLSQGLLQMPFGLLSDRYGRKKLLGIGLSLFALGSLLGGLSTSIYSMIIARILQGTGAIGSVLIALLADLTPNNQRTKAMAVIGMTIGISFSLAMVSSPIITHHYGLSAIFYLTFFLAVLGLILLYTVIPNPPRELVTNTEETHATRLKQVLRDKKLQQLNFGIFMQHLILTATFYVIPLILKQQMQAGILSAQWHFYLPVLLLSFILMLPFIILAERKQKMRPVFLTAVALIGLSELVLSLLFTRVSAVWIGMFVYFTAFNILEATLPSMISKQAHQQQKGTAMGVYSTCQFLGIFFGGTLSGITFQHTGITGVFLLNAAFSLLWFGVSWSIQIRDR